MSCTKGESPRYPTGKTGDMYYKGLLAENEERVNHKAAFLAARDAEYAAWKDKNGVVDERTETVDPETGVTMVRECRGMVCGGAMSRDFGKMYNTMTIPSRTRGQQRNLRDPRRSKGWHRSDTRRKVSQVVLDVITEKWGE